jgi:hypothetical protein
VQGVQIGGAHVVISTSPFIGHPDATSSIENDVWSLSGRGQIHQGQAASITVKVESNGIKRDIRQ